MKAQRGNRSMAEVYFLTSALDGVGGQRPATAALPLGKIAGTHRTRDWMGPRASLDRCEKSRPHRDPTPGPSSEYKTPWP